MGERWLEDQLRDLEMRLDGILYRVHDARRLLEDVMDKLEKRKFLLKILGLGEVCKMIEEAIEDLKETTTIFLYEW